MIIGDSNHCIGVKVVTLELMASPDFCELNFQGM